MRTRKSSRAILLNEENEVFLFKFEFASLVDSKTLQVTPGGGLENGESFKGLSRGGVEGLYLMVT